MKNDKYNNSLSEYNNDGSQTLKAHNMDFTSQATPNIKKHDNTMKTLRFTFAVQRVNIHV